MLFLELQWALSAAKIRRTFKKDTYGCKYMIWASAPWNARHYTSGSVWYEEWNGAECQVAWSHPGWFHDTSQWMNEMTATQKQIAGMWHTAHSPTSCAFGETSGCRRTALQESFSSAITFWSKACLLGMYCLFAAVNTHTCVRFVFSNLIHSQHPRVPDVGCQPSKLLNWCKYYAFHFIGL